jgi:hypothetical protein
MSQLGAGFCLLGALNSIDFSEVRSELIQNRRVTQGTQSDC